MDRRTFLLAAAATAACSGESNSEAVPRSASAPLGVQLYTVRDLMAADPAATLDLVAAAGFEQVEFAGYYDLSPGEWGRLLALSGLTPVAAHVGQAEFIADVDRTVAHASEMGHAYLVIPAVPDSERSTLDDYRRHAENFNRWGEAAANAGIQFAYHNHMFEFDEIDGQIPYDLLLAETDPELVKMELDFCWAEGADADAISYFEAWPGRFPLCHLKDFADGRDANIGTGSVDFDRLLSYASTAGLRYGFVERDYPDDAARSIRAGFDAIVGPWMQYVQSA